MSRVNHCPSSRRAALGFSLIELLVVSSIIVILMALVGGVGIAVIRNQKASATQNLLSTLDRALDEYKTQNGGNIPPFRVLDYIGVPGPDVTDSNPDYFVDYQGSTLPLRPDAAVFLRQAIGFGQVQAIVSGLGEQFLRVTTTPAGTTPTPSGSDWDRDLDTTPSVVDAWGEGDWQAPWGLVQRDDQNSSRLVNAQRVVMYVHPQNTLAQQFLGRCENKRPYFVSAGPDGFYGLPGEQSEIEGFHKLSSSDVSGGEDYRQFVLKKAREDNIYSYRVKTDFLIDPVLLP